MDWYEIAIDEFMETTLDRELILTPRCNGPLTSLEIGRARETNLRYARLDEYPRGPHDRGLFGERVSWLDNGGCANA